MDFISFVMNPKEVKSLLKINLWKQIEGPKSADFQTIDLAQSSDNIPVLISRAAALRSGIKPEDLFPASYGLIEYLKTPFSAMYDVNDTQAVQKNMNVGSIQNVCPQLFGLQRIKYRDAFLDQILAMTELIKNPTPKFWTSLYQMTIFESTCDSAINPSSPCKYRWETILYNSILIYHTNKFYPTMRISKKNSEALDQYLDSTMAYLGAKPNPLRFPSSLDNDLFFISGDKFCFLRYLKIRPTINHTWSMYGDYSMASQIGENGNSAHYTDPEKARNLTKNIKTLSIYNIRADIAYEIDLKNIPQNARDEMSDRISKIKKIVQK